MAIKYVDGTNGSDSNGGGVDDPYATIRKAVASISSGASVSNRNTIIIHSGTYVEGPIRGGNKNNIKFTTAGDGNVHIKYGNFLSTDSHRLIEHGEGWNFEGNGLDLVFFAHGGLGVEQHTSEFYLLIGCSNSGSGADGGSQSTQANNVPMTASSCVFLGSKYTYLGRSPNESQADQDGFGDAVYRPVGPIKNCVLLHLSKIGGSRSNGKLDFNGNLVYMTGMTGSAIPDGSVFEANPNSDFCNNTLVQCSGGAQLNQFPTNTMFSNFFSNCISYGANATSTNNYFLYNINSDGSSTSLKGNLIRGMTLQTVNSATTTWRQNSEPSSQMSGTATNMLQLSGAGHFVGFEPRPNNSSCMLSIANKGYSAKGGIYENVKDAFIFHCSDAIFPKNLLILPFGGKSVGHTAEKSSLVDAEGITGRSIATIDLTTDLLGNTYLNRAATSVGCFAGNYVEFAFQPEEGRDSTDIIDGDFTINNHDEVRKSRFANIDTALFSESTKAVTNLRGRQTSYRVTTTKT